MKGLLSYCVGKSFFDMPMMNDGQLGRERGVDGAGFVGRD
jgi:hypothetical protein